MKPTSPVEKKAPIENPFLTQDPDLLWKNIESLPKKRISKEELLKMAQESKSKSKK